MDRRGLASVASRFGKAGAEGEARCRHDARDPLRRRPPRGGRQARRPATQAPPLGGPTLEPAVRRHFRPDDPASVYSGTSTGSTGPSRGYPVARTKARCAAALEAVRARETLKEYWAVVEPRLPGRPRRSGRTGSVGDDAGPAWSTRAPRHAGPARPDPVAVEPGSARVPGGSTWLRLWPETGRTHQLRGAGAGCGWPVLGDRHTGRRQAFPDGIAYTPTP